MDLTSWLLGLRRDHVYGKGIWREMTERNLRARPSTKRCRSSAKDTELAGRKSGFVSLR